MAIAVKRPLRHPGTVHPIVTLGTGSTVLSKYPNLPSLIQFGFDVGIRTITSTFTPPNKASIEQHAIAFEDYVNNEFRKGRYLGPSLRLKSNRYWVLSSHHHFPSSPNRVESTNSASYRTSHFHTLQAQLTTRLIPSYIPAYGLPSAWTLLWHLRVGLSETLQKHIAPYQSSQNSGLASWLDYGELIALPSTPVAASVSPLSRDHMVILLMHRWILFVLPVLAPSASGPMIAYLFASRILA